MPSRLKHSPLRAAPGELQQPPQHGQAPLRPDLERGVAADERHEALAQSGRFRHGEHVARTDVTAIAVRAAAADTVPDQ